jgi:cytochrome o ubiquinol oxidase subunit 1
MILAITVFPILTATVALLSLDRLLGMHFFTTMAGGNAMMYTNLIWMWGHPEVYILIIPAFGIYSEVVATFSRKSLFGYTSAVVAVIAVTALSILVWLHHFFTMGAGANVNAFFGIMTMIIAIPTGVKIFNWLFTMFRGRITFASPMLWMMGFIFTFTIGGMTGVLLSVPGIDFQVHNSLFLVAHFHNTIIGGVVFGYFAGLVYWFPKFFGFTLNEKFGKLAFWHWIIGFFVTFTPLYILGFMGMTRRLQHISDPEWRPLLIIAGIGTAIIFVGVVMQAIQLIVSIRDRKKNKDTTGDPWDGRGLEWSTSSPPPFYNFAVLPEVHGRHAFWDMKYGEAVKVVREYSDIHMPKNTALGLYIALASFFFGFGLVWHMFWMSVLALVAIVTLVIMRSFDDETSYILTKEEILRFEKKHKTL